MPPILASPDGEQQGALDDMCELLRGLGHDVGGAEIPYGTTGIAFTARYFAGVATEAAKLPHPERLSRRTKGFRRLGSAIPRAAARSAPRRGGRQRARDRHRLRARRRPDDADVHQAPDPDRHLRGPRRAVVVQRLLALGAVLRAVQPHRPAGRVGARGFTDDGFPLAVQLVGRPGDEATLVSLAAQIEAARPWADRVPPL